MASKFAAGDRVERKLWPITGIVAIVTAAAPVTAAIYGRISKAKELEITERKHEFETRMAFLDRAIDPTRPREDRVKVLRFLRGVITKDTAMRDWADSELKGVEAEIEALQKENAKLRETRDEAVKKEQEVREKLASLTSLSAAGEEEKRTLKERLESAIRARKHAEDKLVAAAAEQRPPRPEPKREAASPPHVFAPTKLCVLGTIKWTSVGLSDIPSKLQLSMDRQCASHPEFVATRLEERDGHLYWNDCSCRSLGR